jgi:hypothetical protein
MSLSGTSIPKVLVVLATLTGLAVGAQAGVHSSARGVGMGGAYTALARGADAAKFNPANLGLTDYRTTNFEIVGLGVNLSNNAFSLGDYNKYTGALLTDADKADILGRIPDDGLDLKVEARVTALSASFGSFAVTATGIGVADVRLSRDVFELVLNGNTFADTIDVTGSGSDAYSYAALGLSYGLPIYNAGTRQLAVGATFKYLRGIAVEEVVELTGLAATFATGFSGQGSMIARTATGGRGYGLDIGAALKLNEKYTVGARVENVLGSITWNKQTEEHGYLFSFDTMTVDNMEDDYVVSDDYSRGIGSFSTRLPARLTVGFARIAGRFLWAVDWEQGLANKPGTSTTPMISAGAEYSLLKLIPLRAGFTTGGKRTSSLSVGSGFHLSAFYLDYAFAFGSALPGYSAKGLNFALSMGLNF